MTRRVNDEWLTSHVTQVYKTSFELSLQKKKKKSIRFYTTIIMGKISYFIDCYRYCFLNAALDDDVENDEKPQNYTQSN